MWQMCTNCGTMYNRSNPEDPIEDSVTTKAMKRATANFSLKNCVGLGQNGEVFRGRLPDGTFVAVKRFKPNSADPRISIRVELKVQHSISQHTHPHVRQILGVSFDPAQPLIIYEYLPRGSLRQHLQGRKGDHLLNDPIARLNVAIDVAHALIQLHYNSRFPIFHRDVKSSNILLDADYNAKLADMGIAVVVQSEADLDVAEPLGAFGYKCPVYEQSGRLDDKSDVYSFGVVLMELATFMTAWDTERTVTLLADLVIDRLQRGVVKKLIQPGNAPGGAALMKSLLLVAADCCSLDLNVRPRIDEVADYLERLRDEASEEAALAQHIESLGGLSLA